MPNKPQFWRMAMCAVIAALGGCSKAEQEHHTVSWYQQHADERGAKLTWCADDAARKVDVDCRNAAQAMANGGDITQRFHPPIDWGAKAPQTPAPTNK